MSGNIGRAALLVSSVSSRVDKLTVISWWSFNNFCNSSTVHPDPCTPPFSHGSFLLHGEIINYSMYSQAFTRNSFSSLWRFWVKSTLKLERRFRYAWYDCCKSPVLKSTSPDHCRCIDSPNPETTSQPSPFSHQLQCGLAIAYSTDPVDICLPSPGTVPMHGY